MKCDIWSVGVTLYELAKGYLPFEMHKKEKSAKILLDRINSASKGLPRVEENPLIERLVQGMLVVDPAERMSFE